MREDKTENHESFGIVRICRTSGGDGVLFGSSIRHYNTIRLEVCPGQVTRSLNENRYRPSGRPIVEVEMSQSQFADLITSMNQGEGVPCTIRRLGNDQVEKCPETNTRLQFEAEFTEKTRDIVQRACDLVDEADELLQKKSLRKAERESLMGTLRQLVMELRSNIPFVHSQFNEAMDKTVKEAKGEVEAYLTSALTGLGLESAKDRLLELTTPAGPLLPAPDAKEGADDDR